MFNALTGSNQFVGNWPGVTVEKKEGKLKKHSGVVVTDLPGIYSLSPYTLEEVVARNYLVGERPDVILNIVDGTNLERNLYLTTQLMELGIPMVIAINMMDVVRKNGDDINTRELSRQLGCPIVEISALKGTGVQEAAQTAWKPPGPGRPCPAHPFSGPVEHAIAHIEEAVVHDLPEEQQRWYAVKLFEGDDKVLEQLHLDPQVLAHIQADIQAVEKELDDDGESLITNERYVYIASLLKACYKKRNKGALSASDKIDKVVTNRWLGLPIFAAVMFLVYWISMIGVGVAATDWANDGLFGDGYHLFGMGTSEAEAAAEEYGEAQNAVDAFLALGGTGAEDTAAALDTESESFDTAAASAALTEYAAQYGPEDTAVIGIEDEETLAVEDVTYTGEDLAAAVPVLESYGFCRARPRRLRRVGAWHPRPGGAGPGRRPHPGLAQQPDSGRHCGGRWGRAGLRAPDAGAVPAAWRFWSPAATWPASPSCWTGSSVKFGLSGKSFIPILVGTGCGVPGIMASRTIENERDRRMTIMTTTFIPCSAKMPFISMVAGAIFGGSALVATSAYFLGMACIVISGIMLKKTKPFAGEPAPFVMELPAYHLPTVGNVLRSMWERGWSFIKKAGTVILLSTILIWFLSSFGFTDTGFRMLGEEEISLSLLAVVGSAIAWIFAPLGWGNWQAAVASITGLIAKENIVGTMGVLYGGGESVYASIASVFTPLAGYSFLAFNLLCAPCFAAIGAIKREMNNAKWTWFAIGYQCGFAYVVSLIIFQIGSIFTGSVNIIGLIAALALLAVMIYLLVRPYQESTRLTTRVKA